MTERRLKKSVVYTLYGLAFVVVMASIYILESATNSFKEEDSVYVNDIIVENEIPVNSTIDSIIRPYDASGVSIIKSYYDYQSDATNQQDSLIYYENTYLQNSGIDYGNTESFNVLAILDGVVIDVSENPLLGKTVQLKHDNGLISVYQSLSEVNVAVDQEIQQGTIIGTSGQANIDPKLGNHLHFELILNGTNVNPENYYDKKLSEL